MIIVSPTIGDLSYDPYEYWDSETMVVDVTPHVRISELLAPDGEPLMVGFEKPRVGFNLAGKT